MDDWSGLVSIGIAAIGFVISYISNRNKEKAEKAKKNQNKQNKNQNKQDAGGFWDKINEAWNEISSEEEANRQKQAQNNKGQGDNGKITLPSTGRNQNIKQENRSKKLKGAFPKESTKQRLNQGTGSLGEERTSIEESIGRDDYIDSALSQNSRDLSNDLKQMDQMFDQQAEDFNKSLDKLFDTIEESNDSLIVTKRSDEQNVSPAEKLGLNNQNDLKRGILYKEILDKPVATKRGV